MIAIVDDDADDREIVKDAFLAVTEDREYGLFENGEELLQHLQSGGSNELPELVLLDLNMPGMDGRETLKAIKSHPVYKTIPVLIFTTSSSPKDKSNAYALGANCFISKPDTFQKLTEMAQCVTKLWLR